MGTSGSTSMQAMDLQNLEILAKKKLLQDQISGRNQQPTGGQGGGGQFGGRLSGGGVDQAQRDKELAAELAEKVRSQQAGSDNRIKEDANRANLAEEARAKAAARALELARSVR